MAIADVLDPDGRLFGPRIIAQGAGDSAAVVDLAKRLQAGLEGREMVSIVVDDTSSVCVSTVRAVWGFYGTSTN